jgi:GNAT superfamily N-acetyltransferase
MAAPFVLVLPDETIAGYYTLSSTSVQLPELPAQIVRKLPRYPLVPATLLGRLAVDRRQQGKGYGRFLLADALYRASRSEVASFAVIDGDTRGSLVRCAPAGRMRADTPRLSDAIRIAAPIPADMREP